MDDDDDGLDPLAVELFAETRRDGQSARTVEAVARTAALRESLRQLGRSGGLRLRTAQMGDVVVVARLDAAIWNDSAETMRAKLAPPT